MTTVRRSLFIAGIGFAMWLLPAGSAAANPPSCESSSRGMVANGSFNSGIYCAGSASFQVDSPPSHEEYFFMYPDGEFNYRPGYNFTGTDSFTFHAINADGDSEVATITINVYPAFCYSVANATHTDQTLTIDPGWFGNFCQGEGPLTYEIVTEPQDGSISGFDSSTGALTYTPDHGFEGEDSIGFRVSNSLGPSPEATLFVAVGSDPICEDASFRVLPGGAKPITLHCGGFSPWGFSYEIVRQPNGSIRDFNSTTGTLTYYPSIGFGGRDSFTYRAYNGVGVSNETTVSIDVEPYCGSAVISARYDEPLPISLGCTGVGPLTYELGAAPEHGSISNFDSAAGTLTYTPDPGFQGADSLGFFASNALGSSRFEARKYINICGGPATPACVEALPVAVDDSATLPENAGPTAIDVLANDTDADGGPKRVIARNNGLHGVVAITGGGTGLTYAPKTNYCGTDSFPYRLNGGSTATVSITVTCAGKPTPPVTGGGDGAGQTPVPQAAVHGAVGSTAPFVKITPGVGLVSGRRHPRVAVNGAYASFTLTCTVAAGQCAGTVSISAAIPSLAPTTEKLSLVRERFHIEAGGSALVRAKLTKRARQILDARRTLKGVAGRMEIVDSSNGERGQIDVDLERSGQRGSG